MFESNSLYLWLIRLLYPNKIKYVTNRYKTRDTQSTLPYVSGHTFREISDHIIDDTRVPFSPRSVKEGEVIFLKTKYLRRFCKYMHPQIRSRYILITHYGDEEVPGEQYKLLNDPKLIRWFGMNATRVHPKLTPIPIGLGWVEETLLYELTHNIEKNTLLHLNFNEKSHPERMVVKDYFSKQSFCTIFPRTAYVEYLKELAGAKFTVSPRGNGIDCHRVWESFVLGTIPVMITSPLDSLFEGLPVLIVNKWSDISEQFLKEKYREITSKTYQLDKVYMEYWTKLIQKAKNQAIA